MANIFQNTPPATRNLIIINILVFLAQYVLGSRGVLHMEGLFGLHFVLADNFYPWQIVSYMFLHGSFTHLFFNMFALWMFGVVIERTLGLQRFLTYYFACGIGAAFCQELWQLGEYFWRDMHHYDTVSTGNGIVSMNAFLQLWTTVGASGAVYGILLAFGMLYPNQRIMLLIPPIPMKAKYFVAAYAALELYSAFTSSGNIAHFAHLGGMLFGWLLLRHWKRQAARPTNFTTWTNYSPKKKTLFARIRALFEPSQKTSHARPTAYDKHQAEADYNRKKQADEARLDGILDKIKASGYDSLTREEKDFLFQQSK